MTTPAPEPDRESHYEKTHLAGRPFVLGAVGFVLVMAVIFAVVAALLAHESRGPWREWESPLPPTAGPRWNREAPQLQIDPRIDLDQVRAREDARLHARRWNDPAHAYATIPIEDAMQLLADAAARGQLASVLPAPRPATPLDLQNQKAGEAGMPPGPNP